MTTRLRELRIARGMTQPALAERIGTTKETVYKLEKGQRSLDQHWIEKLTAELNVSADELLGLGEPGSDWQACDQPAPGRATRKLDEELVVKAIYALIRDNRKNPPETEDEILDLYRLCHEFVQAALRVGS